MLEGKLYRKRGCREEKCPFLKREKKNIQPKQTVRFKSFVFFSSVLCELSHNRRAIFALLLAAYGLASDSYLTCFSNRYTINS